MAAVRGILFDCFHTLIDLRFDQMPRLETPEGAVRSSAPLLWPQLREAGFTGDIQAVHQGLVESWLRSETRRRETLEETSATVRLGWLLANLGMNADPALVARLEEIHSEGLLRAMVPIPGAVPLLQSLSGKLRLGLVSNFDRTATVLEALRQLDLLGYFQAVVVSDSAGVVKPHPRIFAAGAAALGLPAAEIAFVGDQPVADMEGA